MMNSARRPETDGRAGLRDNAVHFRLRGVSRGGLPCGRWSKSRWAGDLPSQVNADASILHTQTGEKTRSRCSNNPGYSDRSG